MPDHLKGLLITTLGVLLIVPDSLFIRLIDAGALTIAFWRALLTAVVVGLVVLLLQGPRAFARLAGAGPRVLVYVVAMMGTGLFFVLAVANTSVANTVFIIAATPVFAALLSRIFLGETLSRRTLGTIIAVIAGIGVIAVGSGETEGAALAGDLYALVAALCFASALTAARRLRGVSMVPALPLAYFALALLLLPFAEPATLPRADWGKMALYGCVFIPGATAFISIGPRYLPSAEVSLLILLESVLAPLLVWAVLGEEPGGWALAGGALVLGALAVSNVLALTRAAR